jgi:hypothetical protein
MRTAITILALTATFLTHALAYAADPVCGDVNDSSTITATDALLVLKKSVQQPITLECSAYDEALETCSAQSRTLKTGSTTGVDGALQAGAPRSFTDNGDGTITDNTTGLMWEKKDDAGGIHDRDNQYTWWAVRCVQTPGTIETVFLAALNGGSGFAGHKDWRIPNRFELESLFDFAEGPPFDDAKVYPVFRTGCEEGCTVTTCSCSALLPTWTSTDQVNGACLAYLDDFSNTLVTEGWKDELYNARAVRTAF